MNQILRLAFGPFTGNRASIGLLALRLVMGAAFVIHGLGKIQGPGGAFGFMGPQSTIPGFLQGLGTFAEFGGGLALIIGFLTPLAALGLIVTMIVALGSVLIPMGVPFVASKPGEISSELAYVFLAASVLFLTVGPGKFSLDALLFGNKVKQAHSASDSSLSGSVRS